MSDNINQPGQFVGVGVGPGDPQLLTLKAVAAIEQADVIAYIANENHESLAKRIALPVIEKHNSGFSDLPVVMPMCNDREQANRIYDAAAQSIATYLEQGKRVIFLCEGDPLFFGSFAYLLDRLAPNFTVGVVPGICSIQAAAAECGVPLGLLTENIAIMSGRHSDKEILSTLRSFDNVAIMKAGRPRSRLVELICEAERTEQACYIEYATQAEQKVVRDITTLGDDAGPYFSLFLINCSRDYR